MGLQDYVEHKPILETNHLQLRVLRPEDVNDLLEWTPDKSMYQYWGKSAGKADKDPSLLFTKEDRPSKSFHWGILLKEANKIIGELWVYLIENDRMAKVAFRVSPHYQQKGYATEALQEAVRFCFEQTELKRLWSDVDIRNVSSYRVMEKCGFTREGMIRQGKMVSTWCDYYLYGMLRSDFETMKQTFI